MLRATKSTLVAGLAGLLASGFAAAPASAAPSTLIAAHSGKCLDVYNADKVDRAPIIQFTCHGSSNETWNLVPAGGGYFTVVAQHSGKCLDVYNADKVDRAPVVQFT